jgi:hypothetical protein
MRAQELVGICTAATRVSQRAGEINRSGARIGIKPERGAIDLAHIGAVYAPGVFAASLSHALFAKTLAIVCTGCKTVTLVDALTPEGATHSGSAALVGKVVAEVNEGISLLVLADVSAHAAILRISSGVRGAHAAGAGRSGFAGRCPASRRGASRTAKHTATSGAARATRRASSTARCRGAGATAPCIGHSAGRATLTRSSVLTAAASSAASARSSDSAPSGRFADAPIRQARKSRIASALVATATLGAELALRATASAPVSAFRAGDGP